VRAFKYEKGVKVIIELRELINARVKQGENMPLMKDESQAISKLIVPVLKQEFFVKKSVRVDRLHQKLKTEGSLSPEEVSIKHPFHPDIDVLFWYREYSGEPDIYGVEVKYFRVREGAVYPNIYEGLGEAMMLLTFGVDHASLWHLFDPEIPSEIITRYRDLTQNLVANMPINYRSLLLGELSELIPSKSEKPQKNAIEITKENLRLLSQTMFINSVTLSLKENPILSNWDAKIMRSLLKKAYRIVYK